MAGAINWRIVASDGEARAGIIKTGRSEIETPVFMPVGTQGTVKGVRFEWLEKELNARIILGNTYHLFLRPGIEVIRKLGGLHKFISWDRSILTDSGGFQVFSLADLRKLTEEGVEFRSHVDGSTQFLSPEISMEIQAALGADIVMAFDECPPGNAGLEETRKSVELTARWAARSKKRFEELAEPPALAGGRNVELNTEVLPPTYDELAEPPALAGGRNVESIDRFLPTAYAGGSAGQALFGIIQGAGHFDLRQESLERTAEIGFDGYAIGGLSVGEEKSVMFDIVEFLAPRMPADAPRYLMGVGTPEDLIEAVARGVDMFDCVLPTRNGRTGGVFTSTGQINIRNAKFTTDKNPLDPECGCSVCLRYSRAYLRHLNQSGEMLAAILISHHNLAFYFDLMKKIRVAIKEGRFNTFKREFLSRISDN